MSPLRPVPPLQVSESTHHLEGPIGILSRLKRLGPSLSFTGNCQLPLYLTDIKNTGEAFRLFFLLPKKRSMGLQGLV